MENNLIEKTTYTNRMHKISGNTMIKRLFPATHEFFRCYLDECEEQIILKYKKKERKHDKTISNDDILLRIQNLQFEIIRINQEINHLTKQLE